MPSIEKFTRSQLENALVRARERADKAEKKVRDVPADVELLRRLNKTLTGQVRKAQGIMDLALAEVQEGITDFSGLQLPPPIKLKRGKEEMIAVAHVTDTQIGKITDSFNTEIAEGRLMEYARAVAKCVQVHHANYGVQELHVYFGGDMVEGEQIFAHQPFQIDSSVLRQAIINAPKILAQMLMYWTSYFPKIRVLTVRGNHGRVGNKHSVTHPETNWDTACYLVTEHMVREGLAAKGLAADRVTFKHSRSWYNVDDVLGHKNLLIHGDVGIKGSNGYPWYGTGKRMAGWLDAVPESWQHLYMGHFHQYVSYDWNGHLVFVGGTIESDNEFARAELSATGKPKQRLQIWNRDDGPVVDLPICLKFGYTPRKNYGDKRVTL
jgi:hypothetical protein